MSATTATTAVVTIAIATTAVASATTSAAGEHVDHTLDFVIGSGTVLYDFARESQLLSCQAVVSAVMLLRVATFPLASTQPAKVKWASAVAAFTGIAPL